MENTFGCGTVPLVDAHLSDPFYGNSVELLDILKEIGYDMPEDYLENLDTYGNYMGQKKNYNKSSAPIAREIPIKAWIYRNNDGSGNINISDVYQIIEDLNQIFSTNTNISFYLLCDITEINNSAPANDGDEYFDEMCFYNKVSGAINVYFIISSNLEIDGYDTACAQNGFSYNYSVPPLFGAGYSWSITNGTINYG